MSKQLNVDLRFNADASQAIANIQNLKTSLASIANTPIPVGAKLTSEMQTAIQSAKDLQFHLSNAFNVKTGNLDLNSLNTSLKSSGQSLSDLSSKLLMAGKNGEQAFLNIQKSIATAGVQINKTQGLLGQFMTTLKNTARWQVSSMMLNGLMNGFRTTIQYAEDLDKSLNRIRIVTGASAEEMTKFAETANKAAKSLRTTTNEYAKASLIYFQQGLDSNEVKERTDATVKMANVTGQSAETVSDQMTAIWNNFDNGSKSLEYYADVVTALGAATASSSDEIAQGLEKFAAVADTVGLSYEYATAALATVTATTRQSADVVGTAFKTLFARIQDLDLGKTLDDGTTLGSYSEALYKVGINIKDQAGGLKDMNNILDEMGSKWATLDKDQQVALAKSVAGVRQYTQLIALMDNWDFMKQNIATAETAEGTLQQQAKTYEESWEAANKRVKASLEGIFNDLVPTDAIIDATNAFASILSGLDEIIEGFGGFSNIILFVVMLLLNKMGPALAQSFDQGLAKVQEIGTNFKSSFSNIKSNALELGTQIKKAADESGNAFAKFATKSQEHISNFVGKGKELIKSFSQETKKQAEEAEQATTSKKNGYIPFTDRKTGYLRPYEMGDNAGPFGEGPHAEEYKQLEKDTGGKVKYQEDHKAKMARDVLVTRDDQGNKQLEVLREYKMEKGELIEISSKLNAEEQKSTEATARTKENIQNTSNAMKDATNAASGVDEKLKSAEASTQKMNTNGFIALQESLYETVNGAKNLNEQTQIFEKYSAGANETIQQTQVSIKDAANNGQLLNNAFATHLKDITQINTIQSLINQNSQNLTASAKAQLAIQQEQLLKLAEKKAQEQDVLDTLKAQQEYLLTGDHFDYTNPKYQETDTSSSIMSSSIQSETMAQHITKMLEQFSGIEIKVENINGKLKFTSNTQEGISQAAAQSLALYAEIETENQKVNSIIKNQNVDEKSKLKTLDQTARKLQTIGAIDKKTAGTLRGQLQVQKTRKAAEKEILRILNNTTNETRRGAQALGNSKGIIEDVGKKVQERLIQEEKLNAVSQQYNNTLNNTTKLLASGVQSFTSGFGAAFAKMAQGASTVAMGISSITNAFTTLADEDASWTSKLTAVTMGLTMGLSAFKTVLGGASTVITTYNMQKKLSATLTGNETKAELAQILTEKFGIKSKQAAAMATEIKKKATDGDKNATIQATLAQLGFNAALWPMLIIIVALVAAIAIFSAAASAISDIYNKDAIALENANKALAQQQEVLKEVRQEHEDLINTLNEYETAYDALQKMTQGTDEWKKASEELNAQVVDLITKYPELAAAVKNVNGVLTIDEKAREDLEKASAKRVSEAQIKTYQAQRNANNAKIKSDITDMARKGTSGLGDDWVYWGMSGAIVAAADQAKESAARKEIEKLMSGYESQGESFLSSQSVQSSLDSLATALGTNESAIIDLIRSNTALKTTNDLLLQQEAKAINADNEAYQNAGKYQDVIDRKTAQVLEENNEVTSQDRRLAEQNIFSGDDDYTDYLRAVYGEDYEGKYRVTDTAGDAATVQKFNEETKQWETVGEENGLSSEEVIRVTSQFYANERARQKAAEQVDPAAAVDALVSMEKNFKEIGLSEEAATALASANFLGEDVTFANLKESDLEKLRNDARLLNTEQYQQLLDFDAAGGILGAKNASYKEMWDKANIDYDNEEYKDAEGNVLTGAALEQAKQESAEAKAQLDQIQGWYSQLSEDEKQLAAETVDFKIAQNERLMNQALEQAKEDKAFAGLDSQAEKYELDAEVLKTQAKQMMEAFKEANPELENAAELAADMAVANQRLNKGVDKLTENWKDWKKTLQSSDKTTQDYAEAVAGLNGAIKDILNLSDETIIPADFWGDKKNITLLEQIGNGSEEAVKKLGQNLVKAQIAESEWSADIAKNLQTAFNIDPEESESYFNQIRDNLLSAVTDMQGALSSLKIGESLNAEDAAEFASKLNEYAIATGMSVQEMQDMLNSLSLKADIKTDTQPTEYEVPEYTTFTSTGEAPTGEQLEQLGAGNWTASRQVTVQTGTKKMQGAITVAQIDMGDNPDAPAPKIQGTGRGNIAPSVTTGGKGGNSSKNKKSKKSDTVERFKEENDRLNDLSRAYDNASKSADRLYGENRLKAMRENNKLLKQEYELLSQKAKRGREEYLEEDKANLLKVAGEAGIKDIEFDVNGNITSYEEMMTPLYEELKRATDANNEELAEKVQERIDSVKDAISQYDNTLQEVEDLEDELNEKFYEWQDNNYEALQLELELKLEVNDDDLRMLDYFLSKYENDFYKRSESAGLMGDKAKEYMENSDARTAQKAKLDAEREKGKAFETKKTALDEKYNKGEIDSEEYQTQLKALTDQGVGISEADYIEGLKDIKDGLLEDNEALLELKETMGEYYGETLDMANEKIAGYTDQIDHAASVLDHYVNIANILGKQQDYEMMGNFLSGQAEIAKDQMEVSSAWYDELLAQQKTQQSEYNKAVRAYGKDSEQAKFAKQELDAVTTAVNEAQDKMLSDTEAWLEAEKSVIENEMAKVRKEFEDTFNLDKVMDSFEKLNARNEEFLTTTNKIYETNKMMRTATKAMEATDNKVAKERLNNFIKETQSLQDKNKLSQYELDIQQAKYDLLLAQIALEEAQNAKSTVRLTRDAEGNFGYIYTADENKVADAQQGVDDAENALYNKSLEGQQDYTEKYLSARQDMYDELNELQEKYLNGEIETEEEYNELKEQILEHYMGEDGILTQYSHLYNIAVQADTKATEDYWGSEYGLMTQDTEKWKNAIKGYLTENEGHIDGWKTKSTEAHKSVKEAMNGPDGSKKATEDVTEKSNELKEALIGKDGKGGLVDSLGKELTAVNNATTGFQNQINKIDEVITANEKLITDPESGINALIAKYGDLKASIDAANAAASQVSTTITKTTGTGGDKTLEVDPNKDPPKQNDDGKGVQLYKGDGHGMTENGKSDKTSIAFASVTEKLMSGGQAYYRIGKTNNYVKESDVAHLPDWVKNTQASFAINNKYKIGDKASQTTTSTSKFYYWSADGMKKQGFLAVNAGVGQNDTVSDVYYDPITKSFYYRTQQKKNANQNDWIKESDMKNLFGFDTGGYTGAWGPEGKLAMLHQKELVLNADDTENFLLGIQMLRSISDILERNASLASMTSSNLSAYTLSNSFGQTLEQQVTIQAEFPNVSDHNEIEIAIDNLINRASQFAYKS